MAKFEFDLESAKAELERAENLLSVFLGFFSEERPIGNPPDKSAVIWFVKNCEIYESVIGACLDKLRKLSADMETAIDKACKENRKGGEVA